MDPYLPVRTHLLRSPLWTPYDPSPSSEWTLLRRSNPVPLKKVLVPSTRPETLDRGNISDEILEKEPYVTGENSPFHSQIYS